MGKILALDYGEKSIGYAVSDDRLCIACPRSVLQNNAKFFDKLREIMKEEGIRKIVIGVPLGSDNEETDTSLRAREFGKKIARSLLVQIEYVDEFNTTLEAMEKIPFEKSRRAGMDHVIAAQIILQRYLDSLENKPKIPNPGLTEDDVWK